MTTMVSGYFFVGGGALKRTKEEAEATRQKIIDACYEVIQEKGYEIVPVSELIYRENYHMDVTGRQIKD